MERSGQGGGEADRRFDPAREEERPGANGVRRPREEVRSPLVRRAQGGGEGPSYAVRGFLTPEFGAATSGGGEVAAGPTGPREEERALRTSVGQARPEFKVRRFLGGGAEPPLYRMSPGRRRGTSDLSWKSTQERGFRIKVRRRQGGGEAPPLLL